MVSMVPVQVNRPAGKLKVAPAAPVWTEPKPDVIKPLPVPVPVRVPVTAVVPPPLVRSSAAPSATVKLPPLRVVVPLPLLSTMAPVWTSTLPLLVRFDWKFEVPVVMVFSMVPSFWKVPPPLTELSLWKRKMPVDWLSRTAPDWKMRLWLEAARLMVPWLASIPPCRSEPLPLNGSAVVMTPVLVSVPWLALMVLVQVKSPAGNLNVAPPAPMPTVPKPVVMTPLPVPVPVRVPVTAVVPPPLVRSTRRRRRR